MLPVEEIQARRADLARQLLAMIRSGDWEGTYQYEQIRHWIYCLDWALVSDRRPGEPFASWLERIARE